MDANIRSSLRDIVVIAVVFIGIAYFLLKFPPFACIIFPALAVVMCTIGWLTSTDILENTVENLKKSWIYFPGLATGLCILGIAFFILGSILVFLGSSHGYAVIAFGLLYLTFTYTLIQNSRNNKFVKQIKLAIKLKIKPEYFSNFHDLDKRLRLTRYLFVLGCGVIVVGIILFTTTPTIDEFFISLDIFSIGMTFLIVAGSFEIDVINEITNNKILVKLRSDYHT